jgi:hypothetical protein
VPVDVGLGLAASDASGVSTTPLLSSLEQPTATATATREADPNSTAKRVFVMGTPRDRSCRSRACLR